MVIKGVDVPRTCKRPRTRATIKRAAFGIELFAGTFTECELHTTSFLIRVCWNSVVMTSTGWASAITTKSTQAADNPLLLTALCHSSLIPLPAPSNPQTLLEQRPLPGHFSCLRESTFYHQAGRFAPRPLSSPHDLPRMLLLLLLVVLCSCSCYHPYNCSYYLSYYRSCCWSSFCPCH